MRAISFVRILSHWWRARLITDDQAAIVGMRRCWFADERDESRACICRIVTACFQPQPANVNARPCSATRPNFV